MPEYLAPGVYVEETSFRAKSIEGVGTSTAAFVGPTRKGPVSGGEEAPERPELLTSFGDFERIYGGLGDLVLGGESVPNYIAHAARAFFNEGGSRLYVSRVVVPQEEADDGGATVASVTVPGAGGAVSFQARFAGDAGNGRITVVEVLTPASERTMETAPAGTLLRSDGEAEGTHVYHLKSGAEWMPTAEPEGDAEPEASDASDLAGADPQIVTALIIAEDGDGAEMSWDDVGFDRSHPRGIMHLLEASPDRRAEQLQNAFAIEVSENVSAAQLHERLLRNGTDEGGRRQRVWELAGGSDGAVPDATAYDDALWEISNLEDVAAVAAPGSSAYGDADDARDMMNALIRHCEARRAYRMAVLDTPPGQIPGEVRTLRGQIDSRYAALYYPWVVVPNPNARPGRADIPREIALPPSGFLCGIYARNDVQRGVHKAPANEVVRSATRFEIDVNQGQQELLNPLGVNCLRLLAGRGYRVWGARLISSDPEWKYVSDRRYFNYLEASIDRGTQWAVFEPNGERLWANVRLTISDFLYNEWRNGALLGQTTEEAFFVRCDRSTMTQNDLDNGRLVCLIGVAIIKPAEFVIFRIGQKTADARA
jgi:phage tail sheath protein FI